MTVDDENSIYVGGLPYDCTESQLRRVFELYGSVLAVKIINARDIGGKCYGFVTFTNPRSSVEAINEMDGKTIGGRVVRVNKVKSRAASRRPMQGRESFRNNWRDHDSDGGRSRGREKAYGRDKQRDNSREIDGERERWSDRSRDHHHSRDNIQGRYRDQSRDMQNWEHPSSRKHDRESDREYDLDASNDHSRNSFQGRDRDQHKDTQNWENQSSGKHDRESDRDYGLDANNDHSRDNFQERDRDQHRDMQNRENQSSRKHDRESDREYDLDATKDRQLDRIVEHDRWGQNNKDHQTKRKHSSSYDRPSREHSSESSDHYHQEEQLGSLLKRRDELHKEEAEEEEAEEAEEAAKKGEDEGVKSSSPVQNASYGDLASKKRKSSSNKKRPKKKKKVQTILNTVQKKHAHESEHTNPARKRKHESRSNQNALCSPGVMEKFANDLMPESKSERELDENKEDSTQASDMPAKTKEEAEEEKAEEAEEAAICDRLQRMANYKPATSLKLRIEKYKNPKKSSIYQRIDERVYGIWWVVPEVHYIVKPKIPEKYRLKGEAGRLLKLHFMESQNPALTPANMRTKVVKFDKLKTAYLMPFLRTEYPNLDCPSDNVNYIKRSYETHLSKQSDLHQDTALELMASCHDRFQMATLLLDMRHEAPRFAIQNNCFFKGHPGSDKFQMQIDDLWKLTKELLGSTFYPRLVVKKRKNNIYLHQIALFVNEFMEPTHNLVRYDGLKSQIVTF